MIAQRRRARVGPVAALAVAATLLMTACHPVADVCFSCLTTPDTQMVTAADVGKVRLIHGGGLPARATAVYYSEQCGIDCIQWVRFDSAEADARVLVNRLLAGVAAQVAAPTIPDGPDGLTWWDARPATTPAAYVGNGAQGWPVTILVYPLGAGRSRVFLAANQM